MHSTHHMSEMTRGPQHARRHAHRTWERTQNRQAAATQRWVDCRNHVLGEAPLVKAVATGLQLVRRSRRHLVEAHAARRVLRIGVCKLVLCPVCRVRYLGDAQPQRTGHVFDAGWCAHHLPHDRNIHAPPRVNTTTLKHGLGRNSPARLAGRGRRGQTQPRTCLALQRGHPTRATQAPRSL